MQIGLVAVWCDSELILREGVQHHAPITCLQWSPSGNLLISADEVKYCFVFA